MNKHCKSFDYEATTYAFNPDTGHVAGTPDLVRSRQRELSALFEKGTAAAGRAGEELSVKHLPGGENTYKEAKALDEALSDYKAFEDSTALVEALGAVAREAEREEKSHAVGFDRQRVKNGLRDALQRKGAFGFDVPMQKSLTTALVDPTPSGQLVSEAPPAAEVMALRDLFQTVPTNSGVVRYYRIGAGSGADIVAEGGEKPSLDLDVAPVDANLIKLAVTFTFSDELGDDAGWLVDHIIRQAVRAVLARENALILDTLDGTTGVLTSTGNRSDVLDVLAGAIGAAEATNGITPGRIIAHPTDVAHVRTLKASGSGEYALDPLSTTPTGIHGVPITATPAVTPGTMWLTTSGFGAFYTRNNQLRIETGYAGDDWTHNRATTRVEERVLPAIVRPELLTHVTLTED